MHKYCTYVTCSKLLDQIEVDLTHQILDYWISVEVLTTNCRGNLACIAYLFFLIILGNGFGSFEFCMSL